MTTDELSAIARNTPATDLLEEHGLTDEADVLRAAPAVGDRLERTVKVLEHWVAAGPHICGWAATDGVVRLIAEHRGESAEATLARLAPALRPTEQPEFRISPSGQSIEFRLSNPPPDAHYEIYDGNRRIGHLRHRSK